MANHKPVNHKFFENYSYYLPKASGIFALTGFFLLGAVLGNLVSAAFLAIVGAGAQEAAILISYPVMFIPAMLYASSKSRSNSYNNKGYKLDSSNFAPVGGWLCALMVTVATLAAAYCADALSMLLPAPPEWFEMLMESMTQGNFLINFLSVSIFAPFFEEWLCRGMVLRGLLGSKVKPVWAIIISAAFFAIIHLNPWQALPAFLLGCLFGYVYYKTGSLKLTMLMHFVNNTFSLVMSNIDAVKDAENWMEVFPGAAYWIILAACAILLMLVVRRFAGIPQKDACGNMDEVKALFEE